MRSPDGHFIDPHASGSAGKEVADTVQCCHCGRHFLWTKDTWKKTGWCLNCGRVHCGTEACAKTCIHWEKRMEAYEKQQAEKRRRATFLDAV